MRRHLWSIWPVDFCGRRLGRISGDGVSNGRVWIWRGRIRRQGAAVFQTEIQRGVSVGAITARTAFHELTQLVESTGRLHGKYEQAQGLITLPQRPQNLVLDG